METIIYSEMIPVDNKKKWMKALNLCGLHDTYHLPEYHSLAEGLGEGKPYLFVFRNHNGCAALPFLLRSISEVDALDDCQDMDISSVYGYAGIVTSVNRDAPGADRFRKSFQSSLTEKLKSLNVISFFNRLNPLIPTLWMFEGMAEVSPLGPTIAIDLKSGQVDPVKGMTLTYRYDIRKRILNARNKGVICHEDSDFEHLKEFIRIYIETMDRTEASDYYYFTEQYFYDMKENLGDSLKLFVAEWEGKIISAALFLTTCGIIQYHLSGVPSKYLQFDGAKVILENVHRWGMERGFMWLHLGGGVGSREDSLFEFKSGFSRSQHSRKIFKIAKVVIDPKKYAHLVERRGLWAKQNGYRFFQNSYFPKYRAQICK
ncbi:MAG: GNAT family N-acetyltransferase [Thermodesulfobacteriota bacterium]|nr:GNAT family N-acetyltransferase [Thermodesulfobacteriota bacterium]